MPLRVVLISAGLSGILAIGAWLQGFPLYVIVGAGLLPLIPLIFFEEIWKYEHYGFYSILLAVAILQIGHLGEHTVQIIQLIVNNGDLTKSHGVFGQLDFEDFHFGWDSAVWLGSMLLIYKFPHNKWLWISFAFASLHEVEHMFLFAVAKLDEPYYLHGGLTGIMGKGGLIGSPLPRPYLHFSYNFLVVISVLVAFWDQTKQAFEVHLAKALPDLSPHELVAASNQLRRMKVSPGQDIVKYGDPSDRLYIVSAGKVEVLLPTTEGEKRVALLGPGQLFGELGLMSNQPRRATVRALEATEVLSLSQAAFNDIVVRSVGGLENIQAAVKLYSASGSGGQDAAQPTQHVERVYSSTKLE